MKLHQVKRYEPIAGIKIFADTEGTARQKTITVVGNIEMTITESKEVMSCIGEAIGWLKEN